MNETNLNEIKKHWENIKIVSLANSNLESLLRIVILGLTEHKNKNNYE